MIDEQDFDCPSLTAEEQKPVKSSRSQHKREEVCGDGIDNTGDGQIDEGCSPRPTEQTQPEVKELAQEVCDNGVDDNGNGLVDIQDDMCFPPTQQEQPANQNQEKRESESVQTTESCKNNVIECTTLGLEPTTQCTGNETEAGCVTPIQCPNNTSTTTKCENIKENVPPIANAGGDQEVNEESDVTLDGNKEPRP